MFTERLKKIAVMFCLLSSAGCGLFSDNKELPQGERISILASKETFLHPVSSASQIRVPSPVYNSSWSQTGGNAQHMAGGNLSGAEHLTQVWKAEFGKGNSKRRLLMASPVIERQMVYAQDAEGTVSAFDLSSGERIWKHKIKPLVENESENGSNGSGLAVGNGTLFAVTGFGSIVAMDAVSGKEIWRQETNVPVRTAPTLCSHRLLVQTLDNRLLAYNTANGEVLWDYKVPAEDTVLAGSAVPACDADKSLVVAGFSNGEAEALNLNVGYPLWSVSMLNQRTFNASTSINAIKAAPVIDQDVIYAIGHNDNMAAIDYRTGEKLWERLIGGVNIPWIAGDYIFVLTNTNTLMALNKADGQIVWRTPLLEEYDVKDRSDIYLSGPVMLNSRLIVTASNGMVYSVAPENGQIVHQADSGYKLPMSPVIVDDMIVFVTDDAQLIAYGKGK